MDSNAKNFLVKRNAKSSWPSVIEVRFLVDSSSCSNNKSLTNAKVEHLWNTVFLQLDPGIAVNWINSSGGLR